MRSLDMKLGICERLQKANTVEECKAVMAEWKPSRKWKKRVGSRACEQRIHEIMDRNLMVSA